MSLAISRILRSLTGFLAAAENKHVSYAALYFMVPGVYARTPVIAAWIANNSEPYYRRATSIAMGFVLTNAVCS